MLICPDCRDFGCGTLEAFSPNFLGENASPFANFSIVLFLPHRRLSSRWNHFAGASFQGKQDRLPIVPPVGGVLCTNQNGSPLLLYLCRQSLDAGADGWHGRRYPAEKPHRLDLPDVPTSL